MIGAVGIFVTVLLRVSFVTAVENDRCMKDILVVLDTSFSIGKTNFMKKVKPFLKHLTNLPDLNVSPSGTHIAIMTFSSIKQTKLRLHFKESKQKSQFFRKIQAMRWNNVKGGHTRTELAFQKAGEIFKKNNPLNHRRQYGDVIILLTDGEPHGVHMAKEKAIAEAQILKERGIRIIGLGVGKVNMKTLEAISSPGEAMIATFENINSKLNHLVRGSCLIIPGISCSCPMLDLGDIFIDSNNRAHRVLWSLPNPSCSRDGIETILVKTTPNAQPGDLFTHGIHNIQYTFNVSGIKQQVKCNISFTIKVLHEKSQLCDGKAYSTSNEVCCCGIIYLKMKNHECCGLNFFSNTTHKCCPVATVQRLNQACLGRGSV